MLKRKRVAKSASLVIAIILSLAVSGCQKEIKGSIEVKGEKQVAFAQMAKISLADAINSAVQSYPGKAIRAELKNLDGFLVYSVEVVTQDNTLMDFIVDAGNGNILEKELGKGGKD